MFCKKCNTEMYKEDYDYDKYSHITRTWYQCPKCDTHCTISTLHGIKLKEQWSNEDDK